MDCSVVFWEEICQPLDLPFRFGFTFCFTSTFAPVAFVGRIRNGNYYKLSKGKLCFASNCIRGFRRLVGGSLGGSLEKTIRHRPGNPCFLPSNISIHSIQVSSVQGEVYRRLANITKPCGISPCGDGRST